MAQFVRFLHDAELALVERHLEYAANIQNELKILIRPQIESILYNLHFNQRTESFFITPNLLNVTLNNRYSITACSGTNLKYLQSPVFVGSGSELVQNPYRFQICSKTVSYFST